MPPKRVWEYALLGEFSFSILFNLPGKKRCPLVIGGGESTEKFTSMVSVTNPRGLAWELCRRVFADGAYANLAWEDILGDSTLSRDEKAFATHLAYGTLRHTGTIDAIIEKASGRGASSVDQEVWWVLRLGVFQWLWMRTPAHAVVNESVKLCKKLGFHPASGLVNAVLRKITAKDLGTWLDAITEGVTDKSTNLALRYAHPEWIVDLLEQALSDSDQAGSEGDLAALLDAHNDPATPTLVVLPGLATKNPAETPTAYSPYGVYAEAGSPGADPRVREGRARVQDEGSQLAALVLTSATPIDTPIAVADMCSGPGGKSALIQAILSPTLSPLTAIEKAPHRADLVRQALAPFAGDAPAPRVLTGDASEVMAKEGVVYDRILLDAPCTGLGALRRRPESRWRKSPSDLHNLVALQRELLRTAVEHTAVGGILVYVTCSPVVAETTDQMAWLAADYPVTMLDTPAILERVSVSQMQGHRRGNAVQLWPHRHHTDAMFIQAIRRDG
jgi:16S rRNA (cytosine967-C5)-methyltransferase